MTTKLELIAEFNAIKRSFEIAKLQEGQSLVLYQDYDMLLKDLIERLDKRREFIKFKHTVNAFRTALKLERDHYYGNVFGGGKLVKRKTRKRKITKKIF